MMDLLSKPLISHPAVAAIPLRAGTVAICRAASVDWHIGYAPVVYHPPGDPKGQQANSGVLFRSDTLAPLAITRSNFQVTQPAETVDFYLRVADFFECALVSVGALHGGRLMWGLLQTRHQLPVPQYGNACAHLLLSTRCDSSYAAAVRGLCIFETANATVPIRRTPHPPVRLPYSQEFIAPEHLSEMWKCIVETRFFLQDLVYMSEVSLTWDDMAQDLVTVFSRLRAKAARKEVSAVWNNMREHHRVTPGLPLTPVDLITHVTQRVDQVSPQQNAHGRLNRSWFGAGAEQKQTAVCLALNRLR